MAYNFGTDSRAPQAIASHRDSSYMKRRWYRSISSVLLSLLAVVLGFDGICGERERGTLKQLLTNPIPRAHVVLGKLVGGVISLCVPLTSFLLCLLIVVANDDVVLSADDWVRANSSPKPASTGSRRPSGSTPNMATVGASRLPARQTTGCGASTLIVRYVLSFLCIVLACNAISGELKSGTLRLVLANPLARCAFLMGKFLAHLATLGVAVVSGSGSSLAILVFGGLVQLNGALCLGYLLFLLAAALFAALFLLLSMGVSIQARNSASALVFLVTAWTVLIVVIPQASYLIATQAVPGTGRWWEGMNELRNDTRVSLEKEGTMPRDQDGYAVERRYVRRMQELDKELNQIMVDVEAQRRDQFRATMKVNLLSPDFAFQYSVEAFLGAGLQHVENFGQQGMQYREQLRQFMSSKKLEASHIPRFEPEPIRFADRAGNAVVPLVVLVLEATLAFFFALWAINRAELAGGG